MCSRLPVNVFTSPCREEQQQDHVAGHPFAKASYLRLLLSRATYLGCRAMMR